MIDPHDPRDPVLAGLIDYATRRRCSVAVKHDGVLIGWNATYAELAGLGAARPPVAQSEVMTPEQLLLAERSDAEALREGLVIDLAAGPLGWGWVIKTALPGGVIAVEGRVSPLARRTLREFFATSFPWLRDAVIETAVDGLEHAQRTEDSVVTLDQLAGERTRRTIRRHLHSAADAGALRVNRTQRGLIIKLPPALVGERRRFARQRFSEL